MAEDNKCEREMCTCPVADNSEYCSDQCEKVADQGIIEIKCDCGHQACA